MFFFRAVETEEGWLCRRGRTVIGTHDDVRSAVAHARQLAAEAPPSQVWSHPRLRSPRLVDAFF